jgi:hypothetical protein
MEETRLRRPGQKANEGLRDFSLGNRSLGKTGPKEWQVASPAETARSGKRCFPVKGTRGNRFSKQRLWRPGTGEGEVGFCITRERRSSSCTLLHPSLEFAKCT